jgi:hypothetical protein
MPPRIVLIHIYSRYCTPARSRLGSSSQILWLYFAGLWLSLHYFRIKTPDRPHQAPAITIMICSHHLSLSVYADVFNTYAHAGVCYLLLSSLCLSSAILCQPMYSKKERHIFQGPLPFGLSLLHLCLYLADLCPPLK